MSETTLEERVAKLENLVEQFFTGPTLRQPRRKDWRRTIGMFDGDPVMKEIIDGALCMREEERRAVHAENRKKDA